MNIRFYRVILGVTIPLLIVGAIQMGKKKEIESNASVEKTVYEDNNRVDIMKDEGIYKDPFEKEEVCRIALEKENKRKEALIKTGDIDKENLDKIKYEVSWEKEDYKDNEEDKIIMGSSEEYSDIEGVTCFRGNNYRNSASYGKANIKEEKLEVIWKIPIGSTDRWTGVGWNGQPAIVKWPKELLDKINLFEEKKKKENLKEVIYAALDRNIYFIDLEDGSFTRNKIKIPGPIKGSLTVDPRGIPLLYVGQGISKVGGKSVAIGYRIFSLIDQKMLYFINGRDPFAYRSWGAFDSTAIVDKVTDTMLICGENGIFYKVKLNTEYINDTKEVKINPRVTKYRYKIKSNHYQGIENSIAVYKNLGYFADNGGWIQCIDVNSLKPIWLYNGKDDIDSTIAIESKDEEVSIYSGCEVDKQGKKGNSYIRKLDGLSGKVIWEKAYSCFSKLAPRPNNGGALASPIIGKESIENMVIYNLARYGGFNRGILVALDKETGNELWRLELNNYSWSSPVDVYTKNGDAYIILCDSIGNVYLIKGSTGEVIDKINIGSNVEGSPAIYDNILVIGTRGQKIYGIKIK